jgi:uncharacterized protein YwgA
MTDREEIVAAVISAAGGELTSRVRLQKCVYLLDRLGLCSGFDYDYYHYGPYSRDLDNAMADAEAFDLIEESFAHRMSDGARYSVFKLKTNVKPESDAYGKLGLERAQQLAQKFATTNVTILELAATIDWVCKEEKIADWRREVTKRKSSKVGHGRLDRAVELLRELDLAPPTITAVE